MQSTPRNARHNWQRAAPYQAGAASTHHLATFHMYAPLTAARLYADADEGTREALLGRIDEIIMFHGLTREEALAAVTSTAADIIGLGEEVGSIAKGKHGNVLLLSGDPLSVTTWVEHAVIEGKHVEIKNHGLGDMPFCGKGKELKAKITGKRTGDVIEATKVELAK